MFPTLMAIQQNLRTQQEISPRRLAWRTSWLLPLVLAPTWLFLATGLFPGRPLGTVAGLVLTALVASCSYTDLRWTRIPNWSTYPAFGWALLINLFAEFAAHFSTEPETCAFLLGSIGIKESLAGAAVCFGAMYLMYFLCGTGAGDVKLAAAIGALVGVDAGLRTLAISHVLAFAIVLAQLVWKVGPWRIVSALLRAVAHFVVPLWVLPPSLDQQLVLKRPVPMAAFFAAATLLVYERWIP